MPPEPLPWGERKEFFKERRHERPPPDSAGPPSRWRDSAPQNGFRGRPQGNGRPGTWRHHSVESGRGFTPSRVSDRFTGDDGFRPSGYRMDGRYSRIHRDSRGPFGQNNMRGNTWETGTMPNNSGKPYIGNDPRSFEEKGSFGQKELKGHCWENGVGLNSSGRPYNGSDQRLLDDRGSFNRRDWRGKSWENGVLPNSSSRQHNGNDQSSIGDRGSLGKNDLKGQPSENGVLSSSSGRFANDQRLIDDKGSYGQKNLRGKSCENGVLPNSTGKLHIGSDQSSMDDKGLVGQKNIKGHACENVVLPSSSGMLQFSGNQDAVDDMIPFTSSANSDLRRTQNEVHSKEHCDKSSSAKDLGPGRRLEKDNSVGSIDWKPLKWTRSGSLSSRGSVFSHSSFAKSGDTGEPKNEIPPRDVTPVQSPSGDAAACPTLSAVSSEEAGSRKKPRLKWGEGLAKFEKKKVEGPDDDSATKPGLIVSISGDPSHMSNLADRSPRVAGFMDCASPATPSSVACSSSPGGDDKACTRSGNIDYDTSCSIGSPNLLPQDHIEGTQQRDFCLENLKLPLVVNLKSSLTGLFQIDNLAVAESGFVSSTAMNKLLVWKGEALKALEITESEIDSLENDLKKLITESESDGPLPATSSSLHGNSQTLSCEVVVAPNTVPRPAPLQVFSSGDVETTDSVLLEDRGQVNNQNMDTPTSKFVKQPKKVKRASSPASAKNVKRYFDMDADAVRHSEKFPAHGYSGEDSKSLSDSVRGSQLLADLSSDRGDSLCDQILASNKDTANLAHEVLNKLLPSNHFSVGASKISNIPSWKDDSRIMRNFAYRKRCKRFQERVNTLKFRALQHLWKEDLQLLSMKKNRAKSHKKFEFSLRGPHNSNQKHRSSSRSRLSSSGSWSLVPTAEIISFTNKLLSESQVKPYRNSLKMPALVVDQKERIMSRFISNNGLVEDPCAVEKERVMINPWTKEEKGIFMDKLAIFGKDFKKISSFLDHKTTADCVEFYYKNHKSDCFVKPKKKPEFAKQGKSYSFNNYLVTSGKRWNHETNAASLDVLGEASAVAANADHAAKVHLETNGDKASQSVGRDESHCIFDISVNERETEAADVLAGICGSISSEAMGSCITSSFDRGESYRGFTNQQGGSDDETCSDDSCGEVEPTHWTDEEKSVLIQAVKLYGIDFTMISRRVGTKSRDQCKVFFSKARKCLGLDMVLPRPCGEDMPGENDDNGRGSDNEGACVMETDSVVCSEKSTSKEDKDVLLSDLDMNDMEMNDCKDPDEAEKMVTDDLMEKVKLEVDLESDLKMESCVDNEPKIVVDAISAPLPPDSEEDKGVGEALSSVGSVSVEVANDHGFPASCAEVGTVDPRLGPLEPGLEDQEMASENNSIDRGEENNLNDEQSAKGNCLTDLNCIDQDLDDSGNTSNLSASSDDRTEFCGSLKQEQKITLDLNPPLESLGISLGGGKLALPSSQADYDRITEKLLYTRSSSVDTYTQRQPSPSVFVGLPLQAAIKREINGDMGFDRSVSLQLPMKKIDGNYHTDRYPLQECFLRKCNGSDSQSSTVELPFQSREQKRSHSRHHSWSSSDTEKPSRNGDVKLFGQILTPSSSVPIPNNDSIPENEAKGIQQSIPISKNIIKKPNDNITVDSNSVLGKLDQNNFLCLENRPSRSFGFWDGNRTQNGFPSLPDSALLMAKYPAAFSNFSSPSNMEQQAMHSVVKSNDHNLSSISVFPSREITNGNGVVDYQLYRNQQEMISEMQRRNGIGTFSNLRNPGVVIGPNVGISDPVAAIKMHYAKVDQYGGQTIMLEERILERQADVGR